MAFVEKVKNQLGVRATHRDVTGGDESHALREAAEVYAGDFSGRIEAVKAENTFLRDESVDDVKT